MIVSTRKGNLIELAKQGDYHAIMHGCNCFCTMGAGIAKGIKIAFPNAYTADIATKRGDKNKLGSYSFALHRENSGYPELTVINAYTQYGFKGPGQKVDYAALENVFRLIDQHPNYGKNDNIIGIPKIGAGLAGGSWKTIKSIINENTPNTAIELVEFDQ